MQGIMKVGPSYMKQPPTMSKRRYYGYERSAVFERSAIFENGDTEDSTGGSADPAHFAEGHHVAFIESLQMHKLSNTQFPLTGICSRT